MLQFKHILLQNKSHIIFKLAKPSFCSSNIITNVIDNIKNNGINDQEINEELEQLISEQRDIDQLFEVTDLTIEEETYRKTLIQDLDSNFTNLYEKSINKIWCYIVVTAIATKRQDHVSAEWAHELFNMYEQYATPIYRFHSHGHFDKGILLYGDDYGYGIFRNEGGCHKMTHSKQESGTKAKKKVRYGYANVKVIAGRDETAELGNLDTYVSDTKVSHVSGAIEHKISHKSLKNGSLLNFLQCDTDKHREYYGKETVKSKLLETHDINDSSIIHVRLYNKDNDYVKDIRTGMKVNHISISPFVQEAIEKFII